MARVKVSLMTFSAFSFKNKTHFADRKYSPLSVSGVLCCLQAANICHKINFKLPIPIFLAVAQIKAVLENWLLTAFLPLLEKLIDECDVCVHVCVCCGS